MRSKRPRDAVSSSDAKVNQSKFNCKDVTSVAMGRGGVLVTCAPGKERRASQDTMRLLNLLADELYPSTTHDTAAQPAEQGIEDELELELQQLRDDNADEGERVARNASFAARRKTFQRGRFAHLNLNVRCIALVVCSDVSVDILRLVNTLCTRAKKDRSIDSRFILKMLPLQKICRATSEHITETARALASDSPLANPGHLTTWMLNFRARMANLKRDAVTDAITQLCNHELSDNAVDLRSPETIVLVECVKGIAGVSVIPERNFEKFSKYSIQILTETDAERERRETQRSNSRAGHLQKQTVETPM